MRRTYILAVFAMLCLSFANTVIADEIESEQNAQIAVDAITGNEANFEDKNLAEPEKIDKDLQTLLGQELRIAVGDLQDRMDSEEGSWSNIKVLWR
ncbi:MAG: hypothetical protein GY835_27860 [bacterium]|nr:hypothetical protein [bacterium]